MAVVQSLGQNMVEHTSEKESQAETWLDFALDFLVRPLAYSQFRQTTTQAVKQIIRNSW